MNNPRLEILTSAAMRACDTAAFAAGASSVALMDAAGRAAAEAIMASFAPCPTSVLCGPGANGGDGYVIARRLAEAGWQVEVIALAPAEQLTGDAAIMAGWYPGPVHSAQATPGDGVGLIIDALFGLGLSRGLAGPAARLVEAANAHPAPIVSIDLPSGVVADTGAAPGAVIRASETLTFHRRKPAHLLLPGREMCGTVTTLDIGLEPYGGPVLLWENNPDLWIGTLRPPVAADHKHRRGRVGVVSGPAGRTGAARLAAMGALRAGAGLVTVLSPASAMAENAAHLTAIMLREVEGAAALTQAVLDERFSVVVIGPAAGVGAPTRKSVESLLATEAAAILDADALTSFAANAPELWARLRQGDVLTPHEGEFASLFATRVDQAAGKLAAARSAAELAGAVIVLKGSDTVIAAPDGRAAINANAPADLATAGSGDVLAGVIAGLRAQGMDGFEAACAGVWMHGAAGVAAGPGLIAEDLPPALRDVWRNLLKRMSP